MNYTLHKLLEGAGEGVFRSTLHHGTTELAILAKLSVMGESQRLKLGERFLTVGELIQGLLWDKQANLSEGLSPSPCLTTEEARAILETPSKPTPVEEIKNTVQTRAYRDGMKLFRFDTHGGANRKAYSQYVLDKERPPRAVDAFIVSPRWDGSRGKTNRSGEYLALRSLLNQLEV